MRPPGTKCPHDYIQFCPLYAAMHIANAPSCWPKNNRLEDGCAVDQGGSYEKLLAKFAAVWPGVVAECEDHERQFLAGQQRERNMRANGIH